MPSTRARGACPSAEQSYRHAEHGLGWDVSPCLDRSVREFCSRE